MSKEDEANEKGGHSLWNAPVGAKSASLTGVPLDALDRAEARQLISDVLQQGAGKRVKAYRTQVTQQTLRRKVR
jgi:hypothetical protein